MSDDFKRLAAEAALEEVRNGMRLGIGTGSTAEHFVRALAARVADGLDVIGVPTSERTAALCESLGVRLATLDTCPELDLTVDGADELDARLTLIKGGGGALLREKIVARASARMVVIADETKQVSTLGAFALPVEVVPFGLRATRNAIEAAIAALGYDAPVRLRGGDTPFVTDGQHHILDIDLGQIKDVDALSRALLDIPGVVDHGLFIGIADAAYLAGAGGVTRLVPVP
ncbi:ribose-5-phosphate isomerase RpiA [Stappia stellulata]|uniref:ribose-5-phosphate isomerase RpiA n=1 Tax=Stappia stellulata TaxID=71235 RepID=UPI001CD4BB68|nr:ribose-5-phosphate isomerase RpiA [Stappia stellulata]MCA1241687.1 ribose-5-phosphate isomerase RpiA [Stappia stellulata]|eukprot:jgi/Tetstr1/441748/TSEL_029969.t1